MLLCGCSQLVVSQKSDKQQMEFSVQKLKTEIEDLKQEMKTFQIEVGILEGRLINQEEDLSQMQTHESLLRTGQKGAEFGNLSDKRILEIERTLESLEKRFDRLEIDTKEVFKAVANYKQKFAELEKFLQNQGESLQELTKIRKSLKEMRQEAIEVQLYKVRPGDSIEKIARHFNTTTEQIKKINHLHNDLIIVGQEIKVPK
jgi:chromosome segregation ATPase